MLRAGRAAVLSTAGLRPGRPTSGPVLVCSLRLSLPLAASRAAACVAAAAGPGATAFAAPLPDRHYAIVGAGLAGLATAYHLLSLQTGSGAVHVTVFDAVGVGAGGSGAAAGLLHAFTPKGKVRHLPRNNISVN